MSAAETQGLLRVHVTKELRDVYLVPEKWEQTNILPSVAMIMTAADAERLKACWNALDGVPTGDIISCTACLDEQRKFAGGIANVGSLYDERNKQLDVALSERDQLRAELDAARELLARDMGQQMVEVSAGMIKELGMAAAMVADAAGMVLTVTQVPRKPLAMGNYDTVAKVEVRESHAVYRARDAAEAAAKLAAKGGA